MEFERKIVNTEICKILYFCISNGELSHIIDIISLESDLLVLQHITTIYGYFEKENYLRICTGYFRCNSTNSKFTVFVLRIHMDACTYIHALIQ